MRQSKEEQVCVRVKGLAGKEFVCPIDALRGLKEVPEEILDNCVGQYVVYADFSRVTKSPQFARAENNPPRDHSPCQRPA
jgi:hypothetical protein